MCKTISEEKIPARTGGMCASCGVCSSYCPAQIDIPAAINIYREYFAGDTQTLKKLDEMESIGTPMDCIECGACSARCAYGVDAAGIVRELAMMQSCKRTLIVSKTVRLSHTQKRYKMGNTGFLSLAMLRWKQWRQGIFLCKSVCIRHRLRGSRD